VGFSVLSKKKEVEISAKKDVVRFRKSNVMFRTECSRKRFSSD